MSDGEDPIFFTVIRAKYLEAEAEFGTYVTVSIGTQMLFRTRSEIGESPQWNETHPINASGPQSYSIAVHRETPTADSLLGEITNIIVDSGPQELTLPIELYTGGIKPIIMTASIRRLEDMLILGDNSENHPKRLVCLSDFIIKPIPARRLDLPDSARLSVAIIVNGNSLYETTAAEKDRTESHWSCRGKVILSSGMACTLEVICENPSRYRLGFVQLNNDALERLQEKQVIQTIVQDTNLEILFSAEVLSQDTSNAPSQMWGSATPGMSHIPLSLHDAPDLQDSATALTSSQPSSSHSHLAIGRDHQKDIPIWQTISALSDDCISNAFLLKGLGDILLERFQSEGSLSCLDEAIELFQQAVLPDGHQDEALHLWKLGLALVCSFQQHGKLPDLHAAIRYLEKSSSLFPSGHPEKRMCLGNLGFSYQRLFERFGEISDLEKAISAMDKAVELFPTGAPNKARYLSNLGCLYQTQFERLGEILDLVKAVSALENAVELTPSGHPDKAINLSKLGSSYQLQFERLGEISDLKKAIHALENAVELTPTGHPDKAGRLSNLGMSYSSRFGILGEISDLEKAISALENAVELTPIGHPDKALRLSNLGNSYQSQLERLGDISDLEKAISALENAVELTPTGHPDKAMYLNNLGRSFYLQFKMLGDISDLDKATSIWEKTVELTPTGHPDKAMYLSNLGSSYQSQFERLGDMSDLAHAISAKENAVELTPTGHPDKARHLNNLGSSYQSRFESLGDMSDLAKAISALENAIELGHPKKAMCLNNLGISYLSQFDRLGDISALEKAISAFENAVELTPTGHPDKPTYLNNLGNSYQSQLERLGDISDLEKAISALENAVELTPTGHPNKPMYLSNLGSSFDLQFKMLGDISDLAKAICAFENAVELTPTGHPDKAQHLSNLGSSYQSQFERLGEIPDLEKAISALENAVELTPTVHPKIPMYLQNLANSYTSMFKGPGDISDLVKAISVLESAVELTPTGHPDKAGCFRNLGALYIIWFEALGDISALEKAVSALENAVELTPTGHPDKAGCLSNLGMSYRSRFGILGEISDLEKAISALENAVELTPTGHPSRAIYLLNLGNSFQTQFERLGEPCIVKLAISSFSQASQSTSSQPLICFEAAVSWAKCAELAGLSPIEAYDSALHLLPHVAWIGLTILHRYTVLSDVSNVIHDAALAAISSGKYEMALEWLEQGRSIVWGQLLHLRTPVDELLLKEPQLARQLLAVSQALEKASARETNPESSLSADQIAKNHHLLAAQWDKLIQKVHLVPGFEGFLRPKPVSQLMSAANLGPVIVISIHEAGCHALVLCPTSNGPMQSHLNGPSAQNHLHTFHETSNTHTPPLESPVVHIPLPNFTFEKAQGMQVALKGLCQSILARDVVFEHESQTPQSTFVEILSDLWTPVVLPILTGLAFTVPEDGNLPHIWWCPTGPLAFLPIHAAGLYTTEEPGHKLSDFAVSSYTPTITALLNTQLNSPSMPFKILAIGQASTPGVSPLPNTDTELDILTSHVGHHCVKTLKGAQATVEHTIQGMSESTWVHLACHGTQKPADPIKSAFLLADGDLELSKIIKLSLPHAEFAFLSACQTATGDVTVKEEAAHLAAGMLMAGYRSVIATMWAIMDQDAPQVANDVYAEILKNGQPDYTRAAYALHHATQNLRRGGAPFRSWVPFIHLGR